MTSLGTDRPAPERPRAVRPTSKAVNRGSELFARASARLRRAVPFDGAGWFAMDPSTILPVNPNLIENVETGHCTNYWDREGRVEDALLFRDLARAPQPAGTLRAATDGNPARSARYREYLSPHGYGDELRAAFRTGGSTWGVVVLLRDRRRAPFSHRDLTRVTALGTALAPAIAALATADRAAGEPDTAGGPGTALFTLPAVPVSLDEQAQQWFIELAGPNWQQSEWLISTISAIVARAHAVASERDRGPAAVRLRSPTGRWLSLHASCLHAPDGGPGPAAVVIEPAAPTRIAPIIAQAYGLTPREQQVARGVARGLSNADVATSLHMSPHTVRDHLKATFAKVGVASRGELVATLFADPVRPVPALDDPLHAEW